METVIFKIMPADDWTAAQVTGLYTGSDDDRRDGFIHFSCLHQLIDTAAKHFSAQADLMLLAVDTGALTGTALKWEISRGGDAFPHLYSNLDTRAVLKAWPLPLQKSGLHTFPDDLDTFPETLSSGAKKANHHA